MKNIISFRNTSAGGVERFENSAGGVERFGISARGVERFDSFHGVDKSFKSSTGGVERFDSSHGVDKSFKSSAGEVERFDSSLEVDESFKSSAGGFKDSPHEIQIQPSPEEHKKLFSQNLNCYVNTKVQLFVLSVHWNASLHKGEFGVFEALYKCTNILMYVRINCYFLRESKINILSKDFFLFGSLHEKMNLSVL